MKVLQVTEELHPNKFGGVAKHVHDLSISLSEAGVDVDVFVVSRDDSSGFGNPPFTVLADGGLIELIRRIRNGDYDIVHLHQLGPRPIGYIRNQITEIISQLSGTEVAVTPHGAIDVLASPPGVESSQYPELALKSYLSYVSNVESKFISSFVGVSPGQLELMSQSGVPESKQSMVPNGLTADFFRQYDCQPFVDEYNVSPNSSMIFYIGRISPRKRVSELIQAFSTVRDDHGNTVLYIAGPDGGCLDDIQSLINQLGLQDQVVLMGKIDDEMKHAAYERANVFVNPSEYEAFGITSVEAMAHRTPVVSANNMGAKYVLKDGDCGMLYEIGDVNGLADHLHTMLDDSELRDELMKRGSHRASEFRWKNVVTKMLSLYRKLLG